VLADITPVILTFNEAANIGRSLERLTWARTIVIVDSGSTDETLAIAGRFPNVRSVHRPFDTHAQQWRFATGETGITSEWILRLDADYMLEPDLLREIAALTPAAETSAYRISFTYCMDGRPLRASLYPALPVLFRRGRGSFVQDGHTEKLRIDGPVVPLGGRLLHDDRKSTERWLMNQARYQASEAEKLASRPWSELSWPDRLRCTRVLGPVAVAVHCLIVKGLIFDGTAGLLYTAQRMVADMILSLHLLRRDLGKLMTSK
jgi:glycosyltransferase involved in cell wall biosynthesis